MKIYLVEKNDTLCLFTAPCVSEYEREGDTIQLYLWPSRVLCPDDCVCVIEDGETGIDTGCHKYIDDAELCLSCGYDEKKLFFSLKPRVNLIGIARHYAELLLAETEGQKMSGSLHAALFWTNTFESIIHNTLLFFLFAQNSLSFETMKFLSDGFKYLD